MDFEAELAKFQHLDIEQAEDAIYGSSKADVTDLIQSILNGKAGNGSKPNNNNTGWVEER